MGERVIGIRAYRCEAREVHGRQQLYDTRNSCLAPALGLVGVRSVRRGAAAGSDGRRSMTGDEAHMKPCRRHHCSRYPSPSVVLCVASDCPSRVCVRSSPPAWSAPTHSPPRHQYPPWRGARNPRPRKGGQQRSRRRRRVPGHLPHSGRVRDRPAGLTMVCSVNTCPLHLPSVAPSSLVAERHDPQMTIPHPASEASHKQQTPHPHAALSSRETLLLSS